MTKRKASFLTGTAAAKYQLPAEDHRLNHSGLWLPSSAAGANPLAVQSGVVWGPGNPGNVGVVAGGVNVNPFHAAIQGTRSGVQGVFEVTSDAVEFVAITAASSTTFRRGRLGVRIHDLANGGTKDEWTIEVLYGAAAATAGAAVLPAIPTDSTWFELRQFAVDNAGAITLTGTTPRTIGRGGILPVEATDAVAGAYVGQYRDHPTLGLQRWDGAAWKADGTKPIARFRRDAIHTIPNAAWTGIFFDVTEFALGAGWARNGTLITVPRSGYYRVFGGVSWQLAHANGRYHRIEVNGASVGIGRGSAQAAVDTGVEFGGIVPILAGQTVQLSCYQASGGPLNTSAFQFHAPTYLDLEWLRDVA